MSCLPVSLSTVSMSAVFRLLSLVFKETRRSLRASPLRARFGDARRCGPLSFCAAGGGDRDARYFSERSGDVWRDLGGILEGLGRSWRDLGGSWEILEGSWRGLGDLSWQILGGGSWDSCAARGAAEAPCPVLARLGGAGRRPRRGVAFGAVLEPVLDDGWVCLGYFMSSVENAPRLGGWGWP